ncbi:MAG TPA: hypothetical protein VHC49_07535 [Mycobacteriales bacterium]|nr:hypothetical protein [Mycobacteriales bacterium]
MRNQHHLRGTSTIRSGLGVGITVLLTAVLLAGCGTSRSDYVSEANKTCVSNKRGLDNKHKPKTTHDGIDYALNYFTDLDKAVSRLRELSPPGKDKSQLRKLWLDPAKRSLGEFFDHDLPLIRRASNDGDAATVDRELQRLRHIAGQGVDQDYLRSVGLTGCLDMFGRS